MVAGYVMAGISLGALTGPPDEEDFKDPEKIARWVFFNSLTQFSDPVPVIGDAVTAAAEAAITGKRRYSGSSGIMPVVEQGLGGISSFATAFYEKDSEKRRQKFIRSAESVATAIAIYLGLPASGIKEGGRALGIGDKDGKLDFYWEAFLGRRRNK
jgi:hypothetical protein